MAGLKAGRGRWARCGHQRSMTAGLREWQRGDTNDAWRGGPRNAAGHGGETGAPTYVEWDAAGRDTHDMLEGRGRGMDDWRARWAGARKPRWRHRCAAGALGTSSHTPSDLRRTPRPRRHD
jgi:hypothetical protein